MKKELIRKIYYNYYFREIGENEKIELIKLDKELYYLLLNIKNINRFNNTNEYIDYYLKEYINFEKVEKEDSLYINKKIISIKYPFGLELYKLLTILDRSIDKIDSINIFGLTIREIYIISRAILLRVILYNSFYVKQNITENARKKIFNDINPKESFRAEDIINLLRKGYNIDLKKIKKYLELFSVDIEKIEEYKDIFKLIKTNDSYTMLFLSEFVSMLFEYCEIKVKEYYSNIGEENEYYSKRGKNFEEYVYQILKIVFNDIRRNETYISNDNKKMEIDNLVLYENYMLCFECKSSDFNIYNYNNDRKTLNRLKSKFGKAYISNQTLLDKMGRSNILELGSGQSLNIKPEKCLNFNVTLYPLEFLSTQIHEFVKTDINNFPITINVTDLYSIIIMCNKYESVKERLFLEYAKNRVESINVLKNTVIDVDEIDAFGFVLSDTYTNIKKIINKTNNINYRFMVENAKYRESINNMINNIEVFEIIENFLDKKNKRIAELLLRK
ncbi:MAG: hypothetical protein E7311_07395 [Clostridiales bacterium]|nr:hypothetical protein [Clostridiales bacterium]